MFSIKEEGRPRSRCRKIYRTRRATRLYEHCFASLKTRGMYATSRTVRDTSLLPSLHRDKARRSAIRHMMETFFEGSPEQAVAALLDVSSSKLSQEELDRLAVLIENARGEGKK